MKFSTTAEETQTAQLAARLVELEARSELSRTTRCDCASVVCNVE
jgi:hypothetical protein